MARHRDEQERRRKQPENYPEQDTGVPTPDPEEIEGMELDLRSNAENDWQDEMPAKTERSGGKPKRSGHKGAKATEESDADDDEPNGGFGDGDSARVGGR